MLTVARHLIQAIIRRSASTMPLAPGKIWCANKCVSVTIPNGAVGVPILPGRAKPDSVRDELGMCHLWRCLSRIRALLPATREISI